MSYHTIIIVGNLGRDPEMRYTPAGKAVTSFSVACSRSYTNNNGEKVEETVWFRVSAWEKLAETCNQYLKKGSKVLVEGRLQPDKNGSPRVWQKQDGTFSASFEINATTVRFLSTRSDNGSSEDVYSDDETIGEIEEEAPAQRQAAPAQRQPAPRQANPAPRPATPAPAARQPVQSFTAPAAPAQVVMEDDDLPF